MTKRVQKINVCDFRELDNISFKDLENIDFSGMNKMLDGLDLTADDFKQFEELQKGMSEYERTLYDLDLDFLLQ